MKFVPKRLLVFLLLAAVSVATASAQFGGIVYDPTNYHNALLRYYQLQQQLTETALAYERMAERGERFLSNAKSL